MQLARAGNEIRRSKMLAKQQSKKMVIASAFEAWKGGVAPGTDRGGASGTNATCASAAARHSAHRRT
eukprot:3745158-Heterocapsa_arctica.AAC.1